MNERDAEQRYVMTIVPRDGRIDDVSHTDDIVSTIAHIASSRAACSSRTTLSVPGDFTTVLV